MRVGNIRLGRSLFFTTLIVCGGVRVVAQVGISPGPVPSVPAANALLDLNDVTRGFLVPRFTYAQRPPAPANSLLYYQTDSLDVAGIPQPRGYWYWDGPPVNQWVRVGAGANWQLGGNAGTNPITNFIGTTNNVAMRVKANGVDRINLNTTGQVQIGTMAAPTELLEVNGALRIIGTSDPVPTEGAIRFNSTTGAHDGYVNNPLGGGQISYPNGWYQLENVFSARVKQRYVARPTPICTYPTPIVVPTGGAAGSWPLIDKNGLTANPATSSTLETPFSTFAEDARHQYLYLAEDFIALGICPNTDIRGIAFQAAFAGTAMGMRNVRVSMKNTAVSELNDFEYSGLQLCGSYGVYPAAPFVVVNGWNSFQFAPGTPFQWLGPGYNVVVEFAYDNQDWTTNTAIYYESTNYNATFGIYCDACGSPVPGGSFCYTAGACPGPTPNTSNGVWNAPPGPWSAVAGVQCTGWGWGGFAGGGPSMTIATNLYTCDNSFRYPGRYSATRIRPLIKFDAQTTGTGFQYVNANYLLAREGVTIGDYTAWARSTLYAPGPNYAFKGPGTLSVRVGVWSGGLLVNDHVFDAYYDGRVKPEDGAYALNYERLSIGEMAEFVKRERHLPTIEGRSAWAANGPFSLDGLSNQMWVTAEEQALYIKELHERMEALKVLLLEKQLKESRRKHRKGG